MSFMGRNHHLLLHTSDCSHIKKKKEKNGKKG